MTRRIERTVTINAPPSVVWRALTCPDLMKQWMGEPEVKIEILTDWKVGEQIIVKGFHHAEFENKGTVLQLEPDSMLRYSHLSSLSKLPDKAENYSVMEFRLEPSENQILLMVVVSNRYHGQCRAHSDRVWRYAEISVRSWPVGGRIKAQATRPYWVPTPICSKSTACCQRRAPNRRHV